MIKTLSKLLNNRLLLQKPLAPFTAPKIVDDSTAPLDQATPQQVQEILQQTAKSDLALEPAIETVQGQSLAEDESALATQQIDPFADVNLLESNWKDMAHMINTSYYLQRQDGNLKEQVSQKLQQIEAMYNLDLQKLGNAKIIDFRQFDLRSNINSVSVEGNRYLENNISENTRIGYNLLTTRRLKEFLQSNNMQAIKQIYRNNEFQTFGITADIYLEITEQVVKGDFANHFYLNLIESLRVNDRGNLLVPNKNFQKVLQNINDLQELNKLKFFWKVYNTVENGPEHVNWGIVTHELTKITFDGVQRPVSEKNVRYLYSSLLGKEALKKVINYAFQKYSHFFKDFIKFFALFNLLISRLSGLNESSLSNPHSLNAIFNLFELNLDEPKQILTQIVPEALFETKNKMLFEIYRVHAKFWIERKADPKLSVLAGPFDQFVNNHIDLEDSIRVSYNPWSTEEYLPTRALIRTSTNVSNAPQRLDELLSETKMIEHLMKGEYNFVLNHFLLVQNPGLEKENQVEMRKIILEASEMQFSDENTKALYILKMINEKLFKISEPVAFRQQFLGDFKKIRWLERRQAEPQTRRKTFFEKEMEKDEGKYSRKRAEKLDPEQTNSISNRERIFSKGKAPKEGGALFSKKNKNQFSTEKDSYAEYREVVKELSKDTAAVTEFGFSIKMDRNTDLNTFKEEVERRSREMNETNHRTLFTMTHLPIVGSGSNLLKYLFLKKPEGEAPRVDEKLKRKLKVSFVSQIGALQKDFSHYLQGCRFNFPLAQEVYVALLEDQKSNYVRKSFKTIITHIIAYRKSISDKEVELICDICKKNRIGISLIEYFNLMIENKTFVSKQAIYTLCDTLQKFKKINGDLFMMTKKYCDSIGIDFEITMMSSYVRSLLLEEQDEKLAELCETIKSELRPKSYKLKSELSPEENIRQEKELKQHQKKESNRILNEVINMVVINVNNKLPAFVSELYDEYEKTQTKIEPEDIAISLIVYCNNVEKFLEIIKDLRANKQNIILMTFECAIKALRLNIKPLESHAEQIFNVTLFTHNFMLKEEVILRSVQIFKFLPSPSVFIKFLEYILRYNPVLNYEIKNGMYFVMNSINDDFAKNTISGLLDFIFNSNREKEREEYRKAQIIEEEKVKLLQDLEKKEFFMEETDNQKGQIANDIDAGKLEDAKKQKKNKAPEKIKQEKNAKENQKNKSKVQNPSALKQTKRRVQAKSGEEAFMSQGDGIIQKANLKKKLRSKSLNDFEEMFAQKDEIAEEVDVKGAKGAVKGKEIPQKNAKETKKKTK